MWVIIGSTLVNIVGDYVLIFGKAGFPALGIAGAGWASIAAFVVQVAAFVSIMFRPYFRRRFMTTKLRPDRRLFGRLLRFGLPSGIQFFID